LKDKNIEQRTRLIESANKIVIKVGTRLLTDSSSIIPIIKQIAALKKAGLDVILISSGAVGIGMKTLGLHKRPKKLSEIQALASIGQSKLMSIYERECEKYGFYAAQLLLTAEDLSNRERHTNVLNCINSLWGQGNLPIINENDSVSIAELKLGDNDTLAGLVAVMTRSDLTILLTTVDGLHSVKNGKLHERISVVKELSDEMRAAATGTDDSALSIGGMVTKLTSADIVTVAGEALIIADGRNSTIIEDIFNLKDIGTLFLPLSEKQLKSKQRWLKFFSRAKGKVVIDNGAKKALVNNDSSLLPAGIIAIEGTFERGDTVKILDETKKELARGLSNYSSSDLKKIIGLKSCEVRKLLSDGYDEAIHRNNIIK